MSAGIWFWLLWVITLFFGGCQPIAYRGFKSVGIDAIRTQGGA